MQIRIGKIEFEVEPVPDDLRSAVIADPVMASALRRAVWEWDCKTQAGAPLVPAYRERVVTLPNGLSFLVAKASGDGTLVKNEGPTKKMAERVLKATGAKDLRDLMGALNHVIDLPRLRLPLDVFQVLNGTASYRLFLDNDYAVVRLRAAGRNLSANLLLPSHAVVSAEITDIPDPEVHEASGINHEELRPGFIVPARSPATQGIRRTALARRLEQLRKTVRAQGGADTTTAAQQRLISQLSAEWKALAPKSADTAASA